MREITVGSLEIVHKVGNYLREELHVGMSCEESITKNKFEMESEAEETKAHTSLD